MPRARNSIICNYQIHFHPRLTDHMGNLAFTVQVRVVPDTPIEVEQRGLPSDYKGPKVNPRAFLNSLLVTGKQILVSVESPCINRGPVLMDLDHIYKGYTFRDAEGITAMQIPGFLHDPRYHTRIPPELTRDLRYSITKRPFINTSIPYPHYLYKGEELCFVDLDLDTQHSLLFQYATDWCVEEHRRQSYLWDSQNFMPFCITQFPTS